MRELPLAFPDPLPPELQVQNTRAGANSGKSATGNDGLSREDLELIDRCPSFDHA
jgi:hypothetical protein